MDECFGQGDDVERIGALAFLARNNDPIYLYFIDFIALYEVGVYVSHGEWGNDSETEYQLLGVLDTAKLPLALAENLSDAALNDSDSNHSTTHDLPK